MKYSRSIISAVVFQPDLQRGGSRAGQKYVTDFFHLRKKNYSPDHKANRMHSNDLEAYGENCCYFWFYSEVKFLTRFDVFLDLVISAVFSPNSIDF